VVWVVDACQGAASATVVTAMVHWTPRRACKASTSGASRQCSPGLGVPVQARQAFGVCTDGTKVLLEDIGWAGVGQMTSLRL